MNIKFNKCNFEEIKASVSNYFTSKDILIDSYLEEIILSSTHYKITIDDVFIGFTSIEKKSRLTLFTIFDEYAHLSQDVFYKAKKLEFVNSALCSTSDELFLSCCMDSFKTFEPDGYFTRSNKNELVPFTDIKLELANVEDETLINSLSEDFYAKNLKSMIERKLFYIARKDDEIVGFGHIEPGVIAIDKESVGMYVCENHRGLGFGTDILIWLKNIVLSNNKTPIAGCWYLNHNSLKTQIKAGFFQKTRMVTFK